MEFLIIREQRGGFYLELEREGKRKGEMENEDCLSQFAGHLSRRNYKRVIIGLSKEPSRDSYLGLT